MAVRDNKGGAKLGPNYRVLGGMKKGRTISTGVCVCVRWSFARESRTRAWAYTTCQTHTENRLARSTGPVSVCVTVFEVNKGSELCDSLWAFAAAGMLLEKIPGFLIYLQIKSLINVLLNLTNAGNGGKHCHPTAKAMPPPAKSWRKDDITYRDPSSFLGCSRFCS